MKARETEYVDTPIFAPGTWFNWHFREASFGDGPLSGRVASTRVLAWRLVDRRWSVALAGELTDGDWWLPLPPPPTADEADHPGRWFAWRFRVVGDGEVPDQELVLAWRLPLREWEVLPFADLGESDVWLPRPGAPVRKSVAP